jgi:RimJ/RimL family protein N-acetyltransferase
LKKYDCLQKNLFVEGLYKLLPIRYEDIFLIREWRNEQMDVLRQDKLLTTEDQELYYQEFIMPTFSQPKPKLILFSFLYQDACIGYGGLTHIEWDNRRAEVSFLLATERARNAEIYQKEFRIFLLLLKKIAFEDLRFHELFTETFDMRPKHIAILEDEGFNFQKRAPSNSVFHICRRENE